MFNIFMSYFLRSPIRTNKGREETFVRVIRRKATETEGLVVYSEH